uniref:Uncharacterized protein n=1 Tax=Rhizophora mucronata TaxID=61149 RepID=A0A2P2NQU3_RHIMU
MHQRILSSNFKPIKCSKILSIYTPN